MLKHELIIANDINELNRLSTFLQDVCNEWGLDNELLFKLNLVSEEIISNIILYGYGTSRKGENIHFKIIHEDDRIIICVTDWGKEFNPLNVPMPDDLDKQAEERKIGGLGLYFIRKLMDEVVYKYENKQNILCLTKNIS